MTITNERRLSDGRVELVDTRRVEASPLYNHDLAPVPLARRTWTTYNYAALWVSMAHCIPTYMLASGLMASGMNWKQALFTILLGNTIVLVPILLNSHPGTKYDIPFPVFARAAYGTLGSNVPALMRALVACGWFGIQAWIGGEALHTFFRTVIPGWPALLGAGFALHPVGCANPVRRDRHSRRRAEGRFGCPATPGSMNRGAVTPDGGDSRRIPWPTGRAEPGSAAAVCRLPGH